MQYIGTACHRMDQRQTASNERGVSLALVALAMTVTMGMASLALDLGQGYWTRRALISATDAAALAAAQDYAKSGNGCAGPAATYLTQNEPSATLVSCVTGAVDSNTNRVTITATEPVTTSFGKVVGFGNYSVQSVTTAEWGPPSGVTGLRPMAVCSSSNPAIRNLLNSTANVDTVVTVTYNNQGNACGAVSGNWGVLDFGQSPSTPYTNGLITSGYQGTVPLENHAIASCQNGAEVHCQSGSPGALANANSAALDTLISRGTWFAVPIYNFAEGNGNNRAWFHIIGALRAQLVSYRVNGNQASRSLTFRFHPGLLAGTCCGAVNNGGNKAIAICGVDPNAFAGCRPGDGDDDED